MVIRVFLLFFFICQGDNVVATSSDGYAFVMVLLGGTVKRGETMNAYWIAPNTPQQDPKVFFKSGYIPGQSGVPEV